MNHNARMELARKITNQIVNRYGQDIIGVALYGSVARNEDAEHSDLEFWVATTDNLPSRDALCIYQGQSIELFYGPAESFIADTKSVTPYWPIRADMRRSFVIMYERNNYFERIHEASSVRNEQDFTDAIRERMLRTFELVGKLRNAWAIKDRYDILALSRDMTFSVALIIGLVNRSYYKSQRGMYQRSKEMPLTPEKYEELLDLAGGFSSTDIEQVYDAAIDLWEKTRYFVKQHGVDWDSDELVL